MTNRFLRIFGHELFQLGLGVLVLQEGRMGAAEDTGEFRPRIRGAHVDDAYGLNTHARRFC